MVYGYVLISTKNTYEHRVAEELLDLEEVVDVEHLLVEETAMADPFFKDYDFKTEFIRNLPTMVSF